MEKNPHALYQGLRLTQRIKNKTEEVLKFTWREVNETEFFIPKFTIQRFS